jgi:transcriptional regulator with XRE-family HTH domain
MKPLRPDFAEKVRTLRRALRPKVSQAKLAEDLGVLSTQTVSRWECGISVPEMPTLERMAVYFDKPVSFFLDQGVEMKSVEVGPDVPGLTRIIERQAKEIDGLKAEIERINTAPVAKLKGLEKELSELIAEIGLSDNPAGHITTFLNGLRLNRPAGEKPKTRRR